ncbi:O-methyltransferase-domain-containing protein [Xylariomycetidae sp. FL2044]|nr:O-methyltransferase-domain-containing protein [Xylariomycetidae sp. FL2044]
MASSDSSTRIVQLASTISETVIRIDEMLKSRAHPSPSFDEDAPNLPDEALEMQSVVLDATAELHDLLLSPMALLLNKTAASTCQNSMVPFQFISHMGIASMIPPGGRSSFTEIAAKIGLNEVNVRRILRHAITMRVFQEPEPGMVAYTNISKAIMDSSINDWLKTVSRDLWPAATKTFDAMQKWPDSQEINETAFSIAHNTNMSVYEFFEANSDRALTFVGSLKALTSSPEYDVQHVIENYDWRSLGHAKVADVGGSRGNITVQDRAEVIQGAQSELPEEVRGRVRFEVHDIFAPQKFEADVYYLRWILHNWPDKFWQVSSLICVLILRALIPMLKHDTIVVIQEACLPDPGTVALWKETQLRAGDLSMTALFNSRDRSAGDWKALLSEADPRFILMSVIQPSGSALAILDVHWNAEG